MKLLLAIPKQLPKTKWFAFIIAVAGIGAALEFSYIAELNRSHSVINSNLKFWAPEFADIFSHQDWLRLSKLGKTFAIPPIQSLVFRSGDRIVFSYPMETDELRCDVPETYAIEQYGASFGRLDICQDRLSALYLAATSPLFLVISLSLFFIIGFAALLPIVSMRQGLSRMVDYLTEWSKSAKTSDAPFLDYSTRTNNPSLESKFHMLVQDLVHARLESERKALRDEIVRDVSHNLNSPIASLSIQVNKLEGLSSEERNRLCAGLEQLSEIAEKLKSATKLPVSAVNKASVSARSELPSSTKTEMLSALLDSIVSEKRIEKTYRRNIVLKYSLSQAGYGAFAAINAADFRNVISNLLNNAYEAIDSAGEITVQLLVEGSKTQITIQDTGRGIPVSILDRLFTEGFTYGKANGNGRGLFHAKKTIATWGGSIRIDTSGGPGVKVVIDLPQQESPAWFLPNLDLRGKDCVVVLDDDPSISGAWRYRLPNAEIQSFTDPDSFKEWLAANRHLIAQGDPRALFLVDLRLGASCPTGLDVIEAESLGEMAVLVTSDALQDSVQKRCSFTGARLLWKAEIGCVPVTIQ